MSAPDYRTLLLGDADEVHVHASNTHFNTHPYRVGGPFGGIAATSMDDLADALRLGSSALHDREKHATDHNDPLQILGSLDGVEVQGPVVDALLALTRLKLRAADPYAGIGVTFENNAMNLRKMPISSPERASEMAKILGGMYAKVKEDLESKNPNLDRSAVQQRLEMLFVTVCVLQARMDEKASGKFEAFTTERKEDFRNALRDCEEIRYALHRYLDPRRSLQLTQEAQRLKSV